jgi:Tfp pilus assembly protein PilX
MATAQDGQTRRRGPRPAARLALGLVVALLVVAALSGLVALTLAADDRRPARAPWAQRGAPDVRPQPVDAQ